MVMTPYEKYVQPVTMYDLVCLDCGKDYRAVCPETCPSCVERIFDYMHLSQKEW